MTAPSTWVDPNPPAPQANPRTRMLLGGAAVALTLVVVATLVAVVLLTKGVDSTSKPDDNALALTAANAQVPNPFAPSVVLDRTPLSQETVQHVTQSMAQYPYFPDRGLRLVAGNQDELYGTHSPAGPCDAAAASNALHTTAKSTAWARVFGIRPEQIPDYLNTLTPVTLTIDTAVTAYEYSEGRANPVPTVLQAGNAVLIDKAGVPRVHCESVDPLTPPASRNLSDYHPAGKAWPGFDGQTTVAIGYTAGTPATAVSKFTLIDVSTGKPITRQAGHTIDRQPVPPGTLPDPIATNAAP